MDVDMHILSTACSGERLDLEHTLCVHSTLRAAGRVMLNSSLHSQTLIVNDIGQGRGCENIYNRGKPGVTKECSANKQTFRMKPFNCLSSEVAFPSRQVRPGRSCRANRRRLRWLNAYFCVRMLMSAKGERFNVSIALHRVARHIHVTLANGLTLYTAEVHGPLFDCPR
jgi:hypothetical protein